MLNVFSDSKLKMSEQIKHLQNCAGSNYTRLLFAGQEDEPLYILKPKAINILKYVNQNILFELPKAKTYNDIKKVQWVYVRIRIATNMLNALVKEGILTKDIAIEYHMRMTSRIRKILSEIYAEDLPF